MGGNRPRLLGETRSRREIDPHPGASRCGQVHLAIAVEVAHQGSWPRPRECRQLLLVESCPATLPPKGLRRQGTDPIAADFDDRLQSRAPRECPRTAGGITIATLVIHPVLPQEHAPRLDDNPLQPLSCLLERGLVVARLHVRAWLI